VSSNQIFLRDDRNYDDIAVFTDKVVDWLDLIDFINAEEDFWSDEPSYNPTSIVYQASWARLVFSCINQCQEQKTLINLMPDKG